MTKSIDTLIVGGGQAGLATSYHLTQRGREHIILERASQPGNTWRNDRWDSFTLVTPNWTFRLPGAEYNDGDPGGFMRRVEIVSRFEQYVEHYHLPVQYNVQVSSVLPDAGGLGYLVNTTDAAWKARNVVIATGMFQQHKRPAFSTNLPPEINQLHSGKYRNPRALQPGSVLVVGSGQSGCQIAEELYQSGRKVYLCIGSTGRALRRYRGKDIFDWLKMSGFLQKTVDTLPDPRAKFAANPHVSGRDGGHTLNLHQFARDGVVLLGRLLGASQDTIRMAPNMKENLAKVDQFDSELRGLVDEYIARAGLDAPVEQPPAQLRDGYNQAEIAELDLAAAGITSVIWAIGYSFDYSLVKLPVLDRDGYPIQQRGVTQYKGLYFIGMPWLHTQSSGLLYGVGEDAEYIASKIAGRS
jgi:putative flavoprotein involved in K+ transport